MKKESFKVTFVVLGAILFNVIFWNEKLGLNSLLFAAFIAGCIFALYPHAQKSKICRWLFAAHIVTVAMVIFQNTFLSKIAFSITMLLFISFSQYLHRSVVYAGGSAVLNYVFAIPNFFREIKNLNNKKMKLSGLQKLIRILLVPMLIVTAFMIVYAFANTIFSNIAISIAVAIQNWFMHIFDWFSFERFEFFLLGVLILCGLLLSKKTSLFSDIDLQKKDCLSRKKSNLKKWKEGAFSDLLSVITGRPSSGILALKNEFTIGFISLVMLNLLLLFINCIDIKYVWLGFTFSKDINMAAYVHEGAGLLILSIVLAMILLLFFFRGNLNFYKQNRRLKYASYVWILQNLFLVLSVFNRDYYYISHFGLAYKRIGLLFFLLMVLSGLLTLIFKIRFAKTSYYLIRINAWLAFFLLVVASTVNWDETIAKYNLARKNTIPPDVHFLLSLSDKTLPLIEKNKDVLQNKNEGRTTALQFFEFRKQQFMEEQNKYSWLSWNAADASVSKALKPVVMSSINN